MMAEPKRPDAPNQQVVRADKSAPWDERPGEVPAVEAAAPEPLPEPPARKSTRKGSGGVRDD